jgi:uncharacterized protein (TIGR04551 family)
VTRAAAVAMLAGCASFHPAPLPGAPANATFVDIDGVHVRYREAGSGPAVVLIHGYGASLDSWAPVIPALATSHRVIAVDLKGFGWTSRPEGDYSPAAQAALVWGVLDKLRVADVAIVGHSWGSSVALAMAVAQPQRTRRVAVYDAYVYDDQVPSFFRWAGADGIGELLFGLYYTERIEDRAALAYYDERWVTQARVDRVEADLARPGTTAAALATARGHHFERLHDALRSFAKPVLLLWGENDQVTPLAFGQRLANELANAELKTYPRCGHIPMVEAYAASTRDLAAFLAKDIAAPPRDEAAEAAPTQPTPAAPTAADTAEASAILARLGPPPVMPESLLPIGADLAALGAELSPRLYAAPRDKTELVVHGSLRTRGAYLYNLDLDRGLDARGQPVFPVPLGGGQALDAADLRARTDVAFYARGVGVAVKARVDWLDNVALGGDPDLAGGSPATSGGQRPTTVVVKRAWAEALTPFGTLAVGRMGANFGLGIAANGGDCEDCDHGDAADRLAFVSPLAGHLVAIAYDIASSGPFTRSKDGGRLIGLEPSDRASGPTLAIFKVHSQAALARRAAAGLASVEYGAFVSRRTQDRDVPASYLPIAAPVTFTGNDVVARGFAALGAGGWLRITGERFRIEAEVDYLHASLDQPSLIPGAEITEPVTSSQLGAAIETAVDVGAQIGFDAGYASGDPAPGFGAFPAPGFGAFPAPGSIAPPPGSLDGAQAGPPRDRTVDNFRFHPDYHIDQILFREIIGTITDAIYLRPHIRAALLAIGTGRLEAGAALIASWAVEPTSTPSGQRALGIELDPELRYASRDGFAATLDYGVLFPGAAFDNTMLKAQPAQVIRARLAFVF